MGNFVPGMLDARIAAALQPILDALADIQLTPGPQGVQGQQGIQGPIGATGVAGQNATTTSPATASTNGLESALHFKRNEAQVDAANTFGVAAMIAVPLGGVDMTVSLIQAMPDDTYAATSLLVGVSGVGITWKSQTATSVTYRLAPTGVAVAAAGTIYVGAKKKVPTT